MLSKLKRLILRFRLKHGRQAPSKNALRTASSLDDKILTFAQGFLQSWVPRGKVTDELPDWRAETQAVLDVVSPHHLPHHLVRRIERHDLKITRGLSFKSLMIQESESRRLNLTSPAWLLDGKLAGYQFIDELNIRRPNNDLQTYRFAKLPTMIPAVVKPRQSTGSNGCYLVYSSSSIVHVKDGVQFSSWTEMAAHAESLMNSLNTRALPDRWFIEELIVEDQRTSTPAKDLKFFCFYDEVVFTLEVRRYGGQAEYSFRLPDNTPIVPGDWDYDYFEGDGATLEQLELATQISSQIPHPFCRIDMLKGETELVFGEITPRPGAYHRFYPEWDRTMGEAWARAQNQLQIDLLSGKRFEPLQRATQLLNRAPSPHEPAVGYGRRTIVIRNTKTRARPSVARCRPGKASPAREHGE